MEGVGGGMRRSRVEEKEGIGGVGRMRGREEEEEEKG